jgi:zinc D-Ala-D-Ala carboxypeptidase
MRLTKNFTDDEFKCPCCGKLLDSLPFRAFIAKLQDARNIAGIPFVITSGYRCLKHNKAVGGKPDSSHLMSVAVDIRIRTSSERFLIIGGLMKAGFARLGIGQKHIHVDMDVCKPQRLIWLH